MAKPGFLEDGTPIVRKWQLIHCSAESGAMGRDSYHFVALIEELSRAEAQLAALQWQPITESNLPKVGDEVAGWRGDQIEVIGSMRPAYPANYRILKQQGYTHFRPINPPAQEPK